MANIVIIVLMVYAVFVISAILFYVFGISLGVCLYIFTLQAFCIFRVEIVSV